MRVRSVSNGEKDEKEEKSEEKKKSWISRMRENSVVKLVAFYVIWVIMHYIASNLYSSMCAPLSWSGIFQSVFLTATPHCQGLRWIINTGGTTINSMWLLLAGWVLLQMGKM